MIEQNFMAMTDLAQKHGIKVFLCSITPVSDYTTDAGRARRRGGAGRRLQPRPRRSGFRRSDGRPRTFSKLNAWLKTYARQGQCRCTSTTSRAPRRRSGHAEGRPYSGDGLHPNANGYALMAPVIAAALDRAIR